MSAALSNRSQNNASAQVKFSEVSNNFWEGTRREKTRLKKVSYLLTYLVSQTKIRTFTCIAVLYFLQVFRSSNLAYIGRKGRRFQLCHQFLAAFLLGQDMVMSQMIHRVGPPFLDNHYRGYQ